MTVITHPQPQKPQKQQKSRSTSADQQRSTPHGGAAGLPQKPEQPPQKSTAAPSASPGPRVPGDFCGTSRAFCGAAPQHPNTPGQRRGSRISADSAVSAAGVRPRSRPELRPADCSRTKEARAMKDQKLKLPAVLAEMDVSRAAFYRMRARGQAPRCIKLPNGQIRIRRRDLDAWFESHEEEISC